MSYSSVVIAYGDGFAGNKSLTFRHLMPIINTSHKAQQTSVTASSTHFESLSFIQSTSDISSEVINFISKVTLHRLLKHDTTKIHGEQMSR